VRIPRPSTAAILSVLSDLQRVIASGTFVHAADKAACKWCDFGNACGGSMSEQAAAKQDDPKLDAYRRLVAHD